ncbi:4-hydroxybenzoate octaprenyltransferase [Litorivivens sp.]|uniref:4-hydroxybenzoate octaprenyltransferase n=1 Tax=Litorivivens sp. TaxID=2020868 RepID=UPI003568A07A
MPVDLTQLQQRFPAFIRLMRFDKPIGTYLVLWPTLWALWLAAEGVPPLSTLIIFVLGVVLMRAAGCVINDYADRHIDGHVERTKARPLATGEVAAKEALWLFVGLCLVSFVLVLFTNQLTILLSVAAVALAATYPFMKRHTHFPQVVLGAAFAWSVPMSFAAVQNTVPLQAWLIYLAVVIWTIAYDTFYAMVDRDDDLKIGVKSTAIYFGEEDRLITGILQASVVFILVLMGSRFSLGFIYFVGVAAAAGLFIYQQRLIRFRQRENCFQAFLNNHYVGMVVFIGIALHYLLPG